MNGKAWAREMALYNKWQNETLFGHCAALSDKALRQDRGLFFGSILHTLDHILMVDVRLLDFVVSAAPPSAPFEPRKRVYDDFEALSRARAAFDADLLSTIDGWDEAWFDDSISFHIEALGRTRTVPRPFYAMQMFNHATHHRSQVTSELHRLGIDYGNTDMPFNPLSQY